ncbi:WD40/YVTN/BNR-like repeat-containing protein [Lentisalinibacter salinarum]|uniref:WD40/YVTN/BNR-like repeat-containing protein n=1 Tax=Lentisalinibacter salinarum TaxID=2992239 RepID=UPI0038638900
MMLLVGTEKGLFRVRTEEAGGRWRIDGPHLAGYPVLHTLAAPDGTLYAATAHKIWGAHIYASTDGGDTWSALEGVPQYAPDSGRGATNSIWCLAAADDRLFAGIDPAGLFVSDDRGGSWQPVPGLNEHPTRSTWEPSRGCFAVHSVCVDPKRPGNIVAGVSAGGAYRSEDGGATWQPANAGVRAENLPERYPETGHNVHRVVMHPRRPERLYRQCYNGTYRSDDGARSWTEITAGLPSDFGYGIGVDPHDPDIVFQIPESSSHLRAPVDGMLRVYRSRDAGATWESASRGLPTEHVYVTVLREALDTDSRNPCGVYFGTSGGQLFASADAGGRWQEIASYLPRVLSVKAVQG